MEKIIPQKTLLNYLRMIVGFLILIVLFLIFTTTLKLENATPESMAVRPPHLTVDSVDSIPPSSTESLIFPVRAESAPSLSFMLFWEEFDNRIQDYITIGSEDAMKFQRANFRRAFLDARGMVVDQATGRVFTRTGAPVPIERLQCHLSGFNPERPHMIVNCP